MNYKHGMCGTPTWSSWKTMIRRCRGNNDKARWYADRGITVCERWQDFNNFLADLGERPHGTSLDRIDNNGNYEPENCRWADKTTQAKNKRTNVYFEFNGKRQTLSEWSKELGITREAIKKRIRVGMPPEEVFSSQRFHHRSGWFGDKDRHSLLSGKRKGAI